MFVFIFFIILKVIVGQHKCYSFTSQPRVMGLNDNYEKALQSYLQPIRKLAEDFPEHKVEVQLEIVHATSSRSKPTSKKILYMRKLKTRELPIEQQEIPAYSDGMNDVEAFIDRMGRDSVRMIHERADYFARHQAERHAPPHRALSAHAESISPDYLSAENIAASSSTTETSLQHASTELITAHAYPQQHITSLPNLVNAVYNAPAVLTHTTKRPIYMEDLKKVMDDFEKKLHVLHAGFYTSTTAPSTTASTTVSTIPAGALDEAKRPILKKDLWMALGRQYITECPHQHGPNIMSTQTTVLRARMHKDELMQRLHSNNSNLPKPGKLERIMSLLKKGVNVDRAQPKSADGNLQWLQIKIPKSYENAIKH